MNNIVINIRLGGNLEAESEEWENKLKYCTRDCSNKTQNRGWND